VLVRAQDGNEVDIWLHDVSRPQKTRLTFDPVVEDRPVWYPDGTRFSFSSPLAGQLNIYEQSADGTGKASRLVVSEHPDWASSWSTDGQHLVFHRGQGQGTDIWYLHRKSDGEAQEHPFVKTEFDELSAMLSPDGRYLAFESNKSGEYEVYVRPFPSGDREWQVSTAGGRQPRWRGDGRELFYVTNALQLFAVTIERSPEFRAGTPKRLFQDSGLRGRGQRYDVTPDGLRFVLVKTIKGGKPVIHVVQNWLAQFPGRQRH
jgi:Tol biopolymer transport system component